MEYKNYIARKRVRIHGISGDVNIPYGTRVEAKGTLLTWHGKPICAIQSQNGLDYFVQDDDGCGKDRGELTLKIQKALNCVGEKRNSVWRKVWNDKICQKYRRNDHDDFWLWDRSFFDAPIFDLHYIQELIQN